MPTFMPMKLRNELSLLCIHNTDLVIKRVGSDVFAIGRIYERLANPRSIYCLDEVTSFRITNMDVALLQ